jgi:DNA-3-methyladenine glycosylase II
MIDTNTYEMDGWYRQLSIIKNHLISRDSQLSAVFTTVDNSGFLLHTVIKDPYISLIGAIIGQKITYTRAKSLRGELYKRYGNILNPHVIKDADLSFLGTVPATIISNVTTHIIINNVDLNSEQGIRSLSCINGIGSWTIETTLLTCLKNWDLFPLNDKFLQVRMKRLYGNNVDMNHISQQWSPYRSIVTWYLWRWF